MKYYPVKNNEKKIDKNLNANDRFTKDEDVLNFDDFDASIKEAWFESFENDHYDTEDLDYRYSMF